MMGWLYEIETEDVTEKWSCERGGVERELMEVRLYEREERSRQGQPRVEYGINVNKDQSAQWRRVRLLYV